MLDVNLLFKYVYFCIFILILIVCYLIGYRDWYLVDSITYCCFMIGAVNSFTKLSTFVVLDCLNPSVIIL